MTSDSTQHTLLQAAQRRFATNGYRATTVRNIATDPGVNVALIGRYFGSKDGLFEACIRRSSAELESTALTTPVDPESRVRHLVAHVVNTPSGDNALQFLLLLRSSGDTRADLIRRRALEEFTRKLASRADWNADDPSSTPELLRAQLAIATMLGVVMLRASAIAEPIASAGLGDLQGPLSDVLRTLLVDVKR